MRAKSPGLTEDSVRPGGTAVGGTVGPAGIVRTALSSLIQVTAFANRRGAANLAYWRNHRVAQSLPLRYLVCVVFT